MKELLIKLAACEEATDWVGDKSWEEAYATCHRGDWSLWLFVRTNPKDIQLLTLAKGHCANTVRHLMTDERSLKAVDAAIAFGEGRISRKELKIAAAAAARAADYAAYAWSAAGAAARDAASAAYYAADGYDAAAAAYYASAAEEGNQKLTADICRKYLPIKIWNINL
jgi:hypothetical protein